MRKSKEFILKKCSYLSIYLPPRLSSPIKSLLCYCEILILNYNCHFNLGYAYFFNLHIYVMISQTYIYIYIYIKLIDPTIQSITH